MICFDLIITDLAYVLPKQFLTFQRVQVIYLVWFVTAPPGPCSPRIVYKHEGLFISAKYAILCPFFFAVTYPLKSGPRLITLIFSFYSV